MTWHSRLVLTTEKILEGHIRPSVTMLPSELYRTGADTMLARVDWDREYATELSSSITTYAKTFDTRT